MTFMQKQHMSSLALLLKAAQPDQVFFFFPPRHYTVQWILRRVHLIPKCVSSPSGSSFAGAEKKKTKYHRKKRKKNCPHVSFRPHTKIAIFQKKPPRPESRRDRGMKTCGCKSATDWISWLRWMKGICSFVSWFSAVTERAFSPCPDCRPLRLSKTEATASIQDGLGRHDSSISGKEV